MGKKKGKKSLKIVNMESNMLPELFAVKLLLHGKVGNISAELGKSQLLIARG